MGLDGLNRLDLVTGGRDELLQVPTDEKVRIALELEAATKAADAPAKAAPKPAPAKKATKVAPKPAPAKKAAPKSEGTQS